MVIKFKELGTHQIPGHQAAAEQGGKEEKEGYLISPGKIRPCQYIPCHRGQQNRRYRPNHCYKNGNPIRLHQGIRAFESHFISLK